MSQRVPGVRSPRRPGWPWLCAGLSPLLAGLWLGCGGEPGASAAAAPRSAAAAAPGGAPAALALLVGINQYAPSARPEDTPTLGGAVNDVERARVLLMERFGFTPDQIVVLHGAEATHEKIVTTFQQHLIDRAEASTQVVFWFSGHGSRVPDASGQDGSPRDTGEGPFDETLVAYDSRATDVDGGYDLTDDELFSLLKALRAENVLVVTDCCHSGGVLRGGARAPGVRESRAGTAPLARARLERFWPQQVKLLDDPHDDLPAVVQFAACGAQEEAGEIGTPNGPFGTMTWFLTQVLDEVDPQASWGQVAATVRARVAGFGTKPGQRVQMIGDERRAVFGGSGRRVPAGFQVDRDGKKGFLVGAGSLFGIADGAELALVDLGGKEVGTALVFHANATSCRAQWVGTGMPPDGALRAVPKSLGEGQPRLRIAIEDLDGELLDGSTVAAATAPADADYVLRPDGSQLGLFDRKGRRVRSMARDAAALREALVLEQRFRTLWEGVAAPGQYQLGLRVEPATAEDVAEKGTPAALLQPAAGRGASGLAAVVGAEALGKERGGRLVRFTITNDNDVDLYVALVSATETREVNVLLGASDDNVLRAHGTRSKLVLLGPGEGWPGNEPMVDRYVAVATPRYADFKPFQSAATMVTRGGDADGMPPFLRAVFGGGRTRGDMDRPAWGIASCDLRLVTPDVYAQTQGK